MPRALFAPFAPDVSVAIGGGSQRTVNVLPAGSPNAPHYAPVPKLVNFSSDGLTARCQGAISVRENDGTTYVFAADATKLYLLSAADLGLDDVTRVSGGAYACPTDAFWWFVYWNQSQVICGNYVDACQEYTLGSSTNFAALAGSPPTAREAAVIGPHLMLGGLGSDPFAVQWCKAADATDWTTGGGVDAGDTQSFDEGGNLTGLAGGRLFGSLFQERIVRRITYTRDDNQFQFDEIARDIGCVAPRSIVQLGAQLFFLSQDGFYRFDGTDFYPIGRGRVDDYFYTRVDDNKVIETYGVVDPYDTRIWWTYYTADTDYASAIIGYDFYRDRWFEIEGEGVSVLVQLMTPGITLEQLDTLAPYSAYDLDTLPISLDDRSLQGGLPALGAFNSSNKMAFFNGVNMAATIDTEEAEVIAGRRSLLVNARPLADTDQARVSIGYRETLNASVTYGEAVAQEDNGDCPQSADGRYHRARMTIAEGTDWNEASGVDFEAIDSGEI